MLFYSFFKTLIGQPVVVELKNDLSIQAHDRFGVSTDVCQKLLYSRICRAICSTTGCSGGYGASARRDKKRELSREIKQRVERIMGNPVLYA
ncbi:hypothetical protein HDU82_001019 [Entophlyctis luteolus]|nr:hypothetical protein HDU82_001019 [Entophlyctis luteolus]